MRFEDTSDRIPTDIDPRLQRVIEKSQRESEHNHFDTEAIGDGQVSVIAKVKDIDSWSALPGVQHAADIGETLDKTGRIVTAMVDIHQIEKIRQSPVVLSLKASQPVKPVLDKTIEEIEARKDLLPPGIAKEKGGEGVVVGVVDFGCDFVHQNFLKQNGSTRLLSLWDQSNTSHVGPFGYGKAYTPTEINNALHTPNPYNTLGVQSPLASSRPWHGTHVMDIAAGNGGGTHTPGVAPNADLVFVGLYPSDITWEGANVVDTTFGDSKRLLDALAYIFQVANERSCVINISLGTNGGPHDGTSLVEQGIDALVSAKPNRAVVIAASNSFNDGIHAKGSVSQGGFFDLKWQVDIGDTTDNEMEIWYDGIDEFSMELISPDGTNLGSVELGRNATVKDAQGNVVIFLAHRKHDPNNRDNVIGIFMDTGMPEGKWTVRLHGIRVTNGEFHAWIERDDDDVANHIPNQSNFLPPLDNTYTLGSISCGQKSIVVGSYDAHVTNTPISSFSSAGPTRDGRQKPEISAPGHRVVAAKSGSRNGVVQMSGTSMATPAATGVVALILAEAKALGRNLTIDEIRELVTRTARKNSIASTGWNDRFGHGRIDAKKAIQELTLVPVP